MCHSKNKNNGNQVVKKQSNPWRCSTNNLLSLVSRCEGGALISTEGHKRTQDCWVHQLLHTTLMGWWHFFSEWNTTFNNNKWEEKKKNKNILISLSSLVYTKNNTYMDATWITSNNDFRPKIKAYLCCANDYKTPRYRMYHNVPLQRVKCKM